MSRLHRAIPILALAAALLGTVALPSTASAGPESSLAPPLRIGLLRPLAPTLAIAPEDRIVELVNAERTRAGLPPLTRQAQLSAAAGDYATAMADADFFSHAGADGSLG